MKLHAVIRILDQAEVLSARRKQAGIELLVMSDSRILDLLNCSDGSEFYFDITPMYMRGMRDDSLVADR
jgi:hypothetical protein